MGGKILFVAGARPNFPKIAPLITACSARSNIVWRLVHTGQHYDAAMSDSFFRDLGIPAPHANLGVGGGSHAENTGKTMIAFEKYVSHEKPDIVVVVGDVNATLACGIVAKKCGAKLAHVEAGLRSFDESMPEEINRVLVDRISDYLFVSEQSGIENLQKEGVPAEKIFFVGNVMIDSLIKNLEKKTTIVEKHNLSKYCVVTLHRPSNVDTKTTLEKLLLMLRQLTLQVVWPMHPRTKSKIIEFGLEEHIKQFIITEPLGYLDFITLVSGASAVITDSGGIQEETAYLNVPCITLRENTERPSTIEAGTNVLAGAHDDIHALLKKLEQRKHTIPELWDGKSSERIMDMLERGL